MNVSALSERTLQRDIANSGFTAGPEIQVVVYHAREGHHFYTLNFPQSNFSAKLQDFPNFESECTYILLLTFPPLDKSIGSLAATNPGGWFWIKGDGTDVIKGLWESVRGEWGGDVMGNCNLFDECQKWIGGLVCWHQCSPRVEQAQCRG